MKKILVLACFIASFFSCRKEESTYTKSIFQNKSGHSLEVIPYYQGGRSTADIKLISNNEAVVILDNNNRGKGTGLSYPKYLLPIDSVEIVFDGAIKTVHYRENVKSNNPKAIKYTSPRSIYNESNYVRKITSEDKHNISNEYTFVFTEQDYLDAKK